MAAGDWVQLVLLGAILGVLGQGIRVVIGLKKLSEASAQKGKSLADSFETTTLLVSLLIGAVAGGLAALALSTGETPLKLDKQVILSLLGSGYAGTDFIEGFIKKYLPGPPTP